MTEIEIGRGKRGRTAYSFDDIAIVPEPAHPRPRGGLGRLADRRLPVRDPGARGADGLGGVAGDGHRDRASSAVSGCSTSRGCGPATRTPSRCSPRSPGLDDAEVTRRMQEIYDAPIQPELVAARIAEVRAAGVTVAAALSPQRTAQLWKTVVDAGVDLFVIRGTTCRAEHVSGRAEPLNLKQFIYELDVPVIVGGCATYQAALHLMRTGAAGVLVGFGGGASHTTRVGARRRGADGVGGRRRARGPARLPGRVRRPLRARHRRRRRGPLRRHRPRRSPAAPTPSWSARRSRGPTEAPGPRLPLGLRGAPRRAAARRAGAGRHHRLARGDPAAARRRVSDGSMNLVGALRRAMATTGYSDLKEFQRVEVTVAR